MSITGIMGTSVAGMAAQSDRLGATADNIANVSTNGYKKATSEFSTIVLQGSPQQYDSGSVETHTRRLVGQQGAFEYTRSPTDLAINGDGFFVVSGPGGSMALTRAGAFAPDQQGDLVNAAGYKLLGYELSGGDSSGVINGSVGLVPVNLSSLPLRAAASTAGQMSANLPAGADPVAAVDLPSTNGALARYTAKASLVAYDNLGGPVTLDIYFAKSGSSSWDVAVYDRGGAAATGGFPYAGPALGTGSISFDATTGGIAGTSATSVSIAIPNGQNLALDLSSTRQLAADFAISAARINGNAPVPVERVEFSDKGVLTAVYENGARIPSYRVPLGRVPSPDNMIALSGNVFQPSVKSGDMLIADAGSGGGGTVISSALETSTVDLADELTTMIEAQRNYTANSRVFQTGSELMDVIVNLRR